LVLVPLFTVGCLPDISLQTPLPKTSENKYLKSEEYSVALRRWINSLKVQMSVRAKAKQQAGPIRLWCRETFQKERC